MVTTGPHACMLCRRIYSPRRDASSAGTPVSTQAPFLMTITRPCFADGGKTVGRDEGGSPLDQRPQPFLDLHLRDRVRPNAEDLELELSAAGIRASLWNEMEGCWRRRPALLVLR